MATNKQRAEGRRFKIIAISLVIVLVEACGAGYFSVRSFWAAICTIEEKYVPIKTDKPDEKYAASVMNGMMGTMHERGRAARVFIFCVLGTVLALVTQFLLFLSGLLFYLLNKEPAEAVRANPS
jgi:hypothetical protein